MRCLRDIHCIARLSRKEAAEEISADKLPAPSPAKYSHHGRHSGPWFMAVPVSEYHEDKAGQITAQINSHISFTSLDLTYRKCTMHSYAS